MRVGLHLPGIGESRDAYAARLSFEEATLEVRRGV